MKQVVFSIAVCVCLTSACQITISGGKFNSDDCKGYGRLESKVDILTAKYDRSLHLLKKINEQVKADYANDGNATTFSVTNHDNMPYWWVDLGHVYDIKRIEIINRSDQAGERLHDVDITVGPTLKEMSLCAHYKGPGKTREHLVFHCNQKMRGRYVKVTIKAKEYLQLSEVMVFAPEI
ncbi:unnamed protein product [Mytilus edulis]|uniref:Fucolectin tachylectin-4 pentraxin-1 domain-containing protein n=1 Tax=Mytilus edulis TaxID=6550 RepID=A0A8S3RAL2_MYTED|nr:unnamed protein product [Mytilus edulis]